jgi:Tfp pilus assembly major pilin PilA
MQIKSYLKYLELLSLLAITSFFITIAMPVYRAYLKKMDFSEIIQAADVYRLAVQECYQSQGGGAVLVINCANGVNGVPAALFATGNIASIVTTSAGVITARGRGKLSHDSYILSPILEAEKNKLKWAVSGTCLNNGSCEAELRNDNNES